MLITVMYKNGKVGLVESSELDELICSSKIKKFLRSEGWVTIGTDPVRHCDEGFNGREKRNPLNTKTEKKT